MGWRFWRNQNQRSESAPRTSMPEIAPGGHVPLRRDWSRLPGIATTVALRAPALAPILRPPDVAGTRPTLRPLPPLRRHSASVGRVAGLAQPRPLTAEGPGTRETPAPSRSVPSASPLESLPLDPGWPEPSESHSTDRHVGAGSVRALPVLDSSVGPSQDLTRAVDDFVGQPQAAAVHPRSTAKYDRLVDMWRTQAESGHVPLSLSALDGFAETDGGLPSPVDTSPYPADEPATVAERTFRRPTLAQSRKMGLRGRPIDDGEDSNHPDMATEPGESPELAGWNGDEAGGEARSAGDEADADGPAGTGAEPSASHPTPSPSNLESSGPDAGGTAHRPPPKVGLGEPLPHPPTSRRTPRTGQPEDRTPHRPPGTNPIAAHLTASKPESAAGAPTLTTDGPDPATAVEMLHPARPLVAQDPAARPPGDDEVSAAHAGGVHPTSAIDAAPVPVALPGGLLDQSVGDQVASGGVVGAPGAVQAATPSVVAPLVHPPATPIYRASLDTLPARVDQTTVPTQRGGGLAAEQVPSDIASTFQTYFGVDVSTVAVHRGPAVSLQAGSLSARAFTQGGNVYLPDEAGDVSGHDTRALLAHELVHATQQRVLGSALPPEGTAEGQQLEAAAVATEQWFKGERAEPPPLIHRPAAEVGTADEVAAYAQSMRDELARLTATAPGSSVQRAEHDGQQDLINELRRELDSVATAGATNIPGHVEFGGSSAFAPGGADQPSWPVTHALQGSAGSQSVTTLPGRQEVSTTSYADIAAIEAASARIDQLRDSLAALEQRVGETAADLNEPGALEALAEQLYGHVRSRLRGELIIDRERCGRLTDFR